MRLNNPERSLYLFFFFFFLSEQINENRKSTCQESPSIFGVNLIINNDVNKIQIFNCHIYP